MTEEPAIKRVKAEDVSPTMTTAASPSDLTTFFIRGVSLRHRGDVVNGLLCQWRERLGISDWYEAAAETEEEGGEAPLHLLHNCPIEMVHVESSRRPYFLLEFRYPTDEELARQERNREAGEQKEGEEKKSAAKPPGKALPAVSEESLREIASRLLDVAKAEASTAAYKEKPVSVSVASGSATVAAERHKLELRDAEKKKTRQQQQQEQQKKEAQTANTSAQPSAPATTTSFVPRTVRRRP